MRKFLFPLLFIEMWERFSYYGMLALLVLFLTSQLGFSDPEAYGVYSLFSALCYLGPIVGGYLADNYLGFRKMVLIGSITMVLGHATMALIPLDDNLLYLGLAMIAVGTGFFKGNISNLLGVSYKQDDPERDKAFTLFYVAINTGSTLATIACAYAAEMFGWHIGFALAGVGMLAGLISFVYYQHLFEKDVTPAQKDIDLFFAKVKPTNFTILTAVGLIALSTFMLQNQGNFTQILYWVSSVIVIYLIALLYKLPSDERGNVAFLFTLCLFLMLFFAVGIQLGSLYNLFTLRNVDKVVFGFTIPAAVSQAINPVSIMVFGPFMATLFAKAGDKFILQRVIIGLSCMVLSFSTTLLGCYNASGEGLVNYTYLVVSISFIGVGELCMAPLVINQSTILAPKRLKGFMMGVVMLSLAFASLAGNLVGSIMSVDSSSPEGVSPIESLAIYQQGFTKLLQFSITTVIAFTLIALFITYKNSRKVDAAPVAA